MVDFRLNMASVSLARKNYGDATNSYFDAFMARIGSNVTLDQMRADRMSKSQKLYDAELTKAFGSVENAERLFKEGLHSKKTAGRPNK